MFSNVDKTNHNENYIRNHVNTKLRANNIHLRSTIKGDIPRLVEFTKDEEINKFTTKIGSPLEHDDALAFVKKSAEKLGQHTEFYFAIALNSTSEIVGLISLTNIDCIHRKAEIKFWVGKDFRGNGYANEAIDLTLKFAFDSLSLNKVFAKILATDLRTKKLLENIDFHFEGLLRETLFKNDTFHDQLVFGLLHKEYEA